MKKQRAEPSSAESIKLYLHCRHCLDELPAHTTPREWSRLEIGWTVIGIQVWCMRHKINVVHIDFEGHKHPANLGNDE